MIHDACVSRSQSASQSVCIASSYGNPMAPRMASRDGPRTDNSLMCIKLDLGSSDREPSALGDRPCERSALSLCRPKSKSKIRLSLRSRRESRACWLHAAKQREQDERGRCIRGRIQYKTQTTTSYRVRKAEGPDHRRRSTANLPSPFLVDSAPTSVAKTRTRQHG